MRILAKEKISAHRYKTPEGYLVCVDAILARTGKQQYRHNELFSDSSKDDIVDVDRPYEEVFSEKTIASFENKPFVNEHPHEDVNVSNHRDYAVGFVRDVHEGEVDGEPVLLGNIIVTDEEAIADIESGNKLELSCGYDCDIADEENLCQRNIRGNHVALCKAGRAGIARIIDSKVEDVDIKNRKTRLLKIFKQYNYNRDEAIAEVNSIKGIDEDDIATLVDWIVDIYKDFYTLKDSIKDNINAADKYFDKVELLFDNNKINYDSADTELAIFWFKNESEADKGIKLLNNHNIKYEKRKNKQGKIVVELKDSMEEKMKDSKFKDTQYTVSGTRDKMEFKSEEELLKKFKVESWTEVRGIKAPKLKGLMGPFFNGEGKILYETKERYTSYDSEELVEDGRLIEPEEKYVKEFERMIQRLGFKIDRTGKTISGRLHYQIMSIRNGYTEAEYKRIVREIEKISNTMRNWEIPMTYNIGLHYDGYISAGLDLDKQWVEDSVEDSVKDEAIYMYIADPDEEDDKEIIDRAKSNGLKLEKSGGLTKVIGNLTQLAKALKMLKEDVVAYSKQPRSTIKKVKDSTETTLKLDTVKLINVVKAAKSTKTSCNDAMELSAKTSEELDKLMKQYQKKHPEWKFGEIRKEKGLYRCSVVKDSEIKDKSNEIVFEIDESTLKENNYMSDKKTLKIQNGHNYVYLDKKGKYWYKEVSFDESVSDVQNRIIKALRANKISYKLKDSSSLLKEIEKQISKASEEGDIKSLHVLISTSYSDYKLNHEEFNYLRGLLKRKRDKIGCAWGKGI